MDLPFLNGGDWTKDQLQKIHWLAFEHLVSDLWENQGYRTETTRAVKDGGVDVRAESIDIKSSIWDSRSFLPETELLIIDAKRYSSGRVRKRQVEKLLDTLESEQAERAAIVTSYELTESAEQVALSNGLEWVDGDELVKKLNKSDLNYGDWSPPDEVEQRIRELVLRNPNNIEEVQTPVWQDPERIEGSLR